MQKFEIIVFTGILDIATDDEPQPFVIFVSNGSGRETASEGKVDSDAIDSKINTASEAEVWNSCCIVCIEKLK